jgi:hypothetical protein
MDRWTRATSRCVCGAHIRPLAWAPDSESGTCRVGPGHGCTHPLHPTLLSSYWACCLPGIQHIMGRPAHNMYATVEVVSIREYTCTWVAHLLSIAHARSYVHPKICILRWFCVVQVLAGPVFDHKISLWPLSALSVFFLPKRHVNFFRCGNNSLQDPGSFDHSGFNSKASFVAKSGEKTRYLSKRHGGLCFATLVVTVSLCRIMQHGCSFIMHIQLFNL